jgi:hypothetical protein
MKLIIEQEYMYFESTKYTNFTWSMSEIIETNHLFINRLTIFII